MSSNIEVTGLSKEVQPRTLIEARELGVIGGLIFRNFLTGETINVMPVSYKELKRMTTHDGQARGLLNLMTMPIQAAKWSVLDEKEDITSPEANRTASEGATSSNERDFIHEVLFKELAKGGMSIPFRDVIATMSLSVRDGFKVFEKVFKLDDRSRLVLKKLAFRDNDTLQILSDDHGDYDGVRQRTYFNGRFVDVIIEKEKSVIYTFGRHDNPLYGAPVFLPVYYHFDKKHKLYYISQVAYQMLAVPPRIGTTTPDMTQEAKAQFLKNLASIGFNAAMIKPQECEVDTFESSRTLSDFIPLINHHDTSMAIAILANFINLTTSATGKLSEEQSDIFVLALKSVLQDMEDVFNMWVIPQLIDFNFDSRRYPKLRARPFTDKDQEAIKEVFQKLMTAGTEKNSPEFLMKLEQKMAEQLGISGINYEEVEPRMVKASISMMDAKREAAETQASARAEGGAPSTDGSRGGARTGKEGNA